MDFFTAVLGVFVELCIAAAKAPRKTRGELAKNVDADYYGYRDEEDGIIVPLEQEEEKQGTYSMHYALIDLITCTCCV